MDLMSFMESMGSSSIPLIAAFFIGLMNSISPCTLTTNVTAVAYLTRKMGGAGNTLVTGLLYALGRMLAYTGIASLIVYVGIQTQLIALALQEYGLLLLGPFLVFTGLLMLGHINMPSIRVPKKAADMKGSLARNGYIGSFILGVVFSLAFCPFSAVLYFGMLIPLAIETRDAVMLPAAFGFATGLPVIFLSIILVVAASKVGEALHVLRTLETWMRRVTAVIFIIAGTYLIIQSLGSLTGTLSL